MPWAGELRDWGVDPRVVTISAPYGCNGPVVGQAVAEQLDVPFLDRLIPVEVAKALAVPVSDAVAHDERQASRVGRILAALAASGLPWAGLPEEVGNAGSSEDVFLAESERVIREAARTTGGVILGRAGAIVLRDHPHALHVDLRGSLDRRVRQVLTLSGRDESDVRALVKDNDHNRRAYFRHFYRVEPDDPSLFHLVIDATVLDVEVCTELIIAAARARSRGQP